MQKNRRNLLIVIYACPKLFQGTKICMCSKAVLKSPEKEVIVQETVEETQEWQKPDEHRIALMGLY